MSEARTGFTLPERVHKKVIRVRGLLESGKNRTVTLVQAIERLCDDFLKKA